MDQVHFEVNSTIHVHNICTKFWDSHTEGFENCTMQFRDGANPGLNCSCHPHHSVYTHTHTQTHTHTHTHTNAQAQGKIIVVVGGVVVDKHLVCSGLTSE